jgi:hypothetical protein
VDLAGRAGEYDALLEHCRQREDLLGFAAGLAASDVRPTALPRPS